MDQFNDHLIVFLNEYGATVMGFVLAFLMALWRTAKVIRYETAQNSNAVIKNNIKTTVPNDSLLFEIENATNANSYYRQILRGLIVCSNW